MIDNVVNLFVCELVLYGYSNSPISENSKERDCPMATVPPAKCNFVAFDDATALKHDM